MGKELLYKAVECLDRNGYGHGTNFTTKMVTDLLVGFAEEQLRRSPVGGSLPLAKVADFTEWALAQGWFRYDDGTWYQEVDKEYLTIEQLVERWGGNGSNGWISVKDKLPGPGQSLIFAHKLADGKTWWVGPGYFDAETKVFYCWGTCPVEDNPIDPEYWMPLPSHP